MPCAAEIALSALPPPTLSTIVDTVGGGNAERAISAAQGTAAGSVTAVA